MLLLIRVLSRAVVRPLLRLAQASRSIADGDFSSPDLPVKSSDEVGRLTGTFNQMKHAMAQQLTTQQALHREEVRNLALEKDLEHTRLEVLKSQVNPHFLFNTLQSVANMAGIEQATVTGDMVVRLANFFRYTLDHDDSVVTLDRELALLRDYISLQELRFGERISFEMNCDSRCAACELPKFTLQPIVENSIVHGMRSRSAGGRIRIVTESTPNGCRIQITDNGGGFSRSKMKQNTAEGHRSIGLQNIAGRIALSGGSFRIVSCPGLGTTARIILPMKGEELIC